MDWISIFIHSFCAQGSDKVTRRAWKCCACLHLGAGSWGAGQAASGEPPCCTGSPQSSGLSSPSNETGCKDQSPWEKQGSQSTVMKTASHRLEETSRPEPTMEKIKQAFDRLSTCRSLQSTVLLPKTSQPDTDGEIEQAMECGRGVRESSRPPAALIST